MANELEERKKRRRARKIRRRFLSFLGFVLLLIYIPALWNWFFSVNYKISSISMATLEIKVPVDGLFIRKELPIKSPGDGILIPGVQYGGRVGKGNELVSFIQSDMRDVVQNYRQKEIEILKRVVAEFDSTSGQEREMWENAIESQIVKLIEISDTGNLSQADSVRTAVDNILEAKARSMLKNDSIMNKMGSEQDELDRLRGSIKKSVSSIDSPVSGIVSYKYDGFEETYTAENRYLVTIKQIDEAARIQENHDNWITPAEIEGVRDEPFCKIISNDEAWMAVNVPEEQGNKIKVEYEKAELEGRQIAYDMEIEGVEQRIPITIEKIDAQVDGIIKITGRLTKYIERTMDLRAFKGNLVIQNVTGMQVPLRSLFNVNTVDDTADIAVVEMDKAVFKRIKIVGRQDSYAIIENIDPTDEEEHVNIFDIYLVNPKNIVEGQVVEK